MRLQGKGFWRCGALAVLATVCVSACMRKARGADEASAKSWRVVWRRPVANRPNAPCAFAGGWVVSDAGGGVGAWTADGQPIWRASFSNQVFESGAACDQGRSLLAARDGRVYALDVRDGKVLWEKDVAGAGFRHAPVTGWLGEEAVVWLVSQSDGTLVCLRQRDGQIIWRAESTNRCDGFPAVSGGQVAYGNCDGAVYVFDAASGASSGRIDVGSDDQMAGGLRGDAAARFWGGTRSGSVVLVDAGRRVLEGKVKVSESEAFATPLAIGNGAVATGTAEGFVVFCTLSEGVLKVVRRVACGSNPVEELAAVGDLVGALSGGTFLTCSASGDARVLFRLGLGDDVYGIAVGADGGVACVADQAVVCMKEVSP